MIYRLFLVITFVFTIANAASAQTAPVNSYPTIPGYHTRPAFDQNVLAYSVSAQPRETGSYYDIMIRFDHQFNRYERNLIAKELTENSSIVKMSMTKALAQITGNSVWYVSRDLDCNIVAEMVKHIGLPYGQLRFTSFEVSNRPTRGPVVTFGGKNSPNVDEFCKANPDGCVASRPTRPTK